jgi:predicted amidohydrolase
MENLTVIAFQPDIIWKDIDANLAKYDAMIDSISEKPDLLVFPEMFQTGFYIEPVDVAEKMDGKTARWMKSVSERLGCSIVGSLVIREGRQYFNRALYFDSYQNMTWYDKRHLFTMEQEESKYTAGKSKLIVSIKEWMISFQICYDIRFPVWAKNQNDYDVLINMASWPGARLEAWDTLLKARAIDNQCYAIGVNRVGADKRNLTYAGHSMAIDPKGNVIASLPENTEGMLKVSLSGADLDTYRTEFPVWKDWDRFKLIP